MVQNATPGLPNPETQQNPTQNLPNKGGRPKGKANELGWDRLDSKLKNVMNRVLNKLLRGEELNKTETAIMINYDKLRSVGNKPLTGTKAVADLSDTELEQALGKKPEV